MFTINCRGKLLSLEKPVVIGILNATPDSFYEGHLQKGIDAMLRLAEKMLGEGAAILDIGGQSTRPGSEKIGPIREQERILPLINAVLQRFPEALISVDTYYSAVAKAALDAGAHIINDVSAGMMDAEMIDTVASYKDVPYICMHMKGSPQTMQELAQYDNITLEVLDYFIERLQHCRQAGIKDVIIDPGFGFAKTAEQNFMLLQQMDLLKILKCPILAGISRKATIYKTLGITAAEALNGTTVLNSIALLRGAHLLRVHDVLEARQAIELMQHLPQ